MIQWIESQPTAEIPVVVFGFCYGLAAVIFIAATRSHRGQLPAR